MISEEKLVERDHISNDEIAELMEEFDVTEMDLADECGCSHSTFKIYFQNNSTKMPEKHQHTIIHYFLKKYAEESEEDDEAQENENQESTARDPGTTKEEETDTNQVDKEFDHLRFVGIYFRPKNGLASALEEAAEYASVAKVPVHVKSGQKVFKIEDVQ